MSGVAGAIAWSVKACRIGHGRRSAFRLTDCLPAIREIELQRRNIGIPNNVEDGPRSWLTANKPVRRRELPAEDRIRHSGLFRLKGDEPGQEPSDGNCRLPSTVRGRKRVVNPGPA